MIVRIIAAIAAAAGGAAVARRVADNMVQTRLDTEIEEAKRLALVELKARAGLYSRTRAAEFALRTLKKSAILGFIFSVYLLDEITAEGVRIMLVGAIGAMLAGDATRIARPVALALNSLRRHGWRPARAIREFAAALSFEEAYQRSLTQLSGPQISPVLFLSSFTRHEISNQIGEAIADLARKATIREARPHVIFFLSSVAVVAAIYSACVISAFHAIG